LNAANDADATDLKLSWIREIQAAGLEIGHVIHRHNIDSEEIALQIEAALIDAYPRLTNEVSGHGSGDYGCRTAEQIVAEYMAEEFIPREPLILISIGRLYPSSGRNVYDSVRARWKINKVRAQRHRLVLAHCRGIVVGAFRPERWLAATRANFPWMPQDFAGCWGFEGVAAEPAVEILYLNKRVPDKLRQKGAANPIRFVPGP
jgi:hypothetical protein